MGSSVPATTTGRVVTLRKPCSVVSWRAASAIAAGTPYGRWREAVRVALIAP
ncbi:hypothetical protein [Streptomyces sp. NPDC051665]|uniref:hypothetical protein n=1 Tax=Streptomyces sp. NPDC051665 TaxID=3154647 RepID=UPI00341EA352